MYCVMEYNNYIALERAWKKETMKLQLIDVRQIFSHNKVSLLMNTIDGNLTQNMYSAADLDAEVKAFKQN